MMASMADFGFKPPPPQKKTTTVSRYRARAWLSLLRPSRRFLRPTAPFTVFHYSHYSDVEKLLKKIKFTFFSGGDFGLAPAVHAVQSFGAHAIAAAGEAGTLLGTAHAVVQVAETALAALSVLTTLVLRMLASVFCFSHSQHPLALLSFGSVRLG